MWYHPNRHLRLTNTRHFLQNCNKTVKLGETLMDSGLLYRYSYLINVNVFIKLSYKVINIEGMQIE